MNSGNVVFGLYCIVFCSVVVGRIQTLDYWTRICLQSLECVEIMGLVGRRNEDSAFAMCC